MSIQTRVKGNDRFLLALLLLLTLLVIIDDYRGWRFLLIGLGGTWILSRAWARSLAGNLRLKREMRFGWAQVGDRLEQRFTLTNAASFPAAWIEVEDQSDLAGFQINLATGIEGNNQRQWRVKGICEQRGLYKLGPTSLHTSDPLGLFQVSIHNPGYTSLLVIPPILPLPQIEVAPGGRAHEGRPRPIAYERTVSASGTRPYFPGDSLRWIHWRTSARRDTLHVRTFENRPSGDWWILLDFDEAVQVGEGTQSTLETGVILAASLADLGLRMGKAVGFAAHGGHLIYLPPKHGESQRWQMLQELALLKPGQFRLDELIHLIGFADSANASLVIITPNDRADWLGPLLPLVWRGVVPTVLFLDPAAYDPGRTSRPIQAELAAWGIAMERITPELFQRPEARPGKKGLFDWRVTPSGRAVLVNTPREADWRGIR